MKKYTSVFIIIFSIFTTGCASNQDTGVIVGTVVGVAVGSLFGDGGGEVAGMIVGGAVGALIGSQIGKSLDEGEKARATLAAKEALEDPDGDVINWNSEDDASVSGTAEVVGEAYDSDGSECKKVRELVVVNGEEESAMTEYCLKGSSWVAS